LKQNKRIENNVPLKKGKPYKHIMSVVQAVCHSEKPIYIGDKFTLPEECKKMTINDVEKHLNNKNLFMAFL